MGYVIQKKLLKNQFKKNTNLLNYPLDEAISPLVQYHPKLVDTLVLYWALVPQDTRLTIYDASITFLSSSVNKCNVTAEMQKLEYCLTIPRNAHPFYQPVVSLPQHSSTFSLEGLELSTTYSSALSLTTVQIDTNYKDRKFHLECELQSLLYWYDYRDLVAFLPVLSSIKTSSSVQESSSEKIKVSSFLQQSYDSFDCVVRFRDVAIGLQLPKCPALYLLLYHSYLDTVRGTLLVEGFTSRLGKECCCVRPLQLSGCYCDARASCVTGKCLNRRNSAHEQDVSSKYSETADGFLKVSDSDTRRLSDTTKLDVEVKSNFLGYYGQQNFMKGINRNSKRKLLDDNSTRLSSKPFEDLKYLASQRDEVSKKMHVLGSPLSVGVCHLKRPRSEHVSDGTECHSPGNFKAGTFNRRTYRRSDSKQNRLMKSSTHEMLGGRSSLSMTYYSNYNKDEEDTETEEIDRHTRLEMDDVQAEWSPSLANMVSGAHAYVTHLKDTFEWKSSMVTDRPVESKNNSMLNDLILQCYNVDIFIHSKHDGEFYLP